MVTIDLDLGGEERKGFEVIEKVLKIKRNLWPVVISKLSPSDYEEEALKLGCHVYIHKYVGKRWDNLPDYIRGAILMSQLGEGGLMRIKKILGEQESRIEKLPRYEFLKDESWLFVVGGSKSIQDLINNCLKITSDPSLSVLITGETGTGKEVIAKVIHYLGVKKEGEFVAINCAAIPKELIESELFGADPGAHSAVPKPNKPKIGIFELANGGTLLLDEIGDMDLDLQAKLLRVLREREFYRLGGTKPIRLLPSTRIMAATNRNLKEMMEEGKFRKDLYYRLNVINLHLPPLRERPEDIRLFVGDFLAKGGKKGIDDEALSALLRYPWEGNIAELDNIMRSTCLMAEDSEKIFFDDLPTDIKNWYNHHANSTIEVKNTIHPHQPVEEKNTSDREIYYFLNKKSEGMTPQEFLKEEFQEYNGQEGALKKIIKKYGEDFAIGVILQDCINHGIYKKRDISEIIAPRYGYEKSSDAIDARLRRYCQFSTRDLKKHFKKIDENNKN
jgi:transcriptional regulator with PAS, ATPase and Fis domain